MTKRIAIVGGGIGGLHLGLYLRDHDIDVTIHTDRHPEEYAKVRLLNTVAHHSVTVAREDRLRVNHWPTEQFGYYCHYHYFGGEQPLFFRGAFKSPSIRRSSGKACLASAPGCLHQRDQARSRSIHPHSMETRR